MNRDDVLSRVKTEIDDHLGVQFEEPWQRAQFAGFVGPLVRWKIDVREFSLIAPYIGLGRAYDCADLLEDQLSDVLLGLSEAETAQLRAHYETQIQRMGRKFPELIS